jgi:hypothetical protein
MKLMINSSSNSKMNCAASTDKPLPISIGEINRLRRFNGGVMTEYKKLKTPLYCGCNAYLYGISFEYRNKPTIKIFATYSISNLI